MEGCWVAPLHLNPMMQPSQCSRLDAACRQRFRRLSSPGRRWLPVAAPVNYN
jgi:hypothetical protein